MALWENAPHSVDTHSVTSGADDGGGVELTYTVAQSSVRCSINTVSAAEQLRYAQMQIFVTHTVAFLSSDLTTALTKGMKLVATDTSESYHIRGIRKGRAYGSVPALTYADCEHIA